MMITLILMLGTIDVDMERTRFMNLCVPLCWICMSPQFKMFLYPFYMYQLYDLHCYKLELFGIVYSPEQGRWMLIWLRFPGVKITSNESKEQQKANNFKFSSWPTQWTRITYQLSSFFLLEQEISVTVEWSYCWISGWWSWLYIFLFHQLLSTLFSCT